MNLLVKTTNKLHGVCKLPSSKSHSIRAVFFALLSKGSSNIANLLQSEDADDAIKLCQLLGANFNTCANQMQVKSEGVPLQLKSSLLYTGNSGLTTHFALPLIGLRSRNELPIILDCGEQMRARPVKPLIDVLRKLGLNIKYLSNANKLPVEISGSLRGGNVEVDGSTSQYLSALLLALPLVSQDSEITVRNLCERSYVEMTIQWLQDLGVNCSHESKSNIDIYKIKGDQRYKNVSTSIQSDFSSASYFIAASVMLPGETRLEGLSMKDSQGDKQLVSILQKMGADISIESNSLLIRGGRSLMGIEINGENIPDLLPTLAVIGTYASNKTSIRNARHARIKETDRIVSMCEGLTKMGGSIEEHSDGLTVYHSQLNGANVHGFGDHRTVMALSIAGLIAKGNTIISDCMSINKTFPNYVENMRSLGANMEVSLYAAQ